MVILKLTTKSKNGSINPCKYFEALDPMQLVFLTLLKKLTNIPIQFLLVPEMKKSISRFIF